MPSRTPGTHHGTSVRKTVPGQFSTRTPGLDRPAGGCEGDVTTAGLAGEGETRLPRDKVLAELMPPCQANFLSCRLHCDDMRSGKVSLEIICAVSASFLHINIISK